MNSLNLVGNLTRDLESIQTQSGVLIAKSGLAVNKKIQGVDKTMFIDISFFGKTAEVALQYLHKGSKIAVSGELEFEQWQDQQTGANRSKHAMSVAKMTMLDSKSDNQDQGNQNQQNGGYNQNQNQGQGQPNNNYQGNQGQPNNGYNQNQNQGQPSGGYDQNQGQQNNNYNQSNQQMQQPNNNQGNGNGQNNQGSLSYETGN